MSNRTDKTYGLDPNYAAQNKWYLYLPMKTVIGSVAENLDLAVNQFYLPGLEIPTATTSYKGYSVQVPQPKLINPGEKTMKFRYIVNDDWYNYSSLYTWAAKLGILNNEVDANTTIQAAANAEGTSDFMTARLYLLSPFKKKIVEFIFEYAFMKNFGELLLTYENSNPVTHDITLAYNFYKIDRHTPIPIETKEGDNKNEKATN